MNRIGKNYIFFFLLIGLLHCSFAQKGSKIKETLSSAGIKHPELPRKANLAKPYPEVDSLELILSKQQDDTDKVKTLIWIAGAFGGFNVFDSCLLYAERAEKLANKLDYREGDEYALRFLGMAYFHQSRFTIALKDCQQALEISEQNNYKKEEIEDLNALGNIYAYTGAYDKELLAYTEGLKIARELDDKLGICNGLIGMGIAYNSLGELDKSLDYYLKAESQAEKMGATPQLASVLGNIGLIYGAMHDYTKAIDYTTRAITLKQNNNGGINKLDNSYLNLADLYQNQGNDAKAEESSLKALSMARETGDQIVAAHSLGELGIIYYNHHDNAKALNYFNAALSIAKEIGDIDEVAHIYSGTGGIYNELKQYKKAEVLFDSSLILSKRLDDKENIAKTYLNISTMDSSLGNYKETLEDYKLYELYHDSLLSQEKLKKITQLEMTRRFEKEQDSMTTAQKKVDMIKETEQRKKRIINNSVISIMALLIVWVIVLFSRQRIKRKNDKLIFEQEKQHMELELANAKALLDDYIKEMVEKTSLLEQSKIEMEELKKDFDEKRIESLEHLNKATILTEEDWNKFKQLFEQVHKGFFNNLKEKLPQLTLAEVRLICLTKLQLGDKQMADILGVSYTTIKQTRYRLRKKLGLSESDSIDDIVASI